MDIAILAGGLATRLGGLSSNKPKSMIEICGKPFIYYQLEYIRKFNFNNNVVLCINHLGNQIKEYVKNGEQFSLNVLYSYDGDVSLGTGGAILNALNKLSDNFIVLYGDSYLPLDYNNLISAYYKKKCDGMITVYKNNNMRHISNIEYKNNEIISYHKELTSNKMNHVDYGFGIYSKRAFNSFEKEKNFDMFDVNQFLLSSKSLGSLEVKEQFYEIGSLEGINYTNSYFTNNIIR
jgi:NDP-sugar pyrophosphorylase family protein